jgi:hypothetical protein
MKKQSRRRFINNIVAGTAGLTVASSCTVNPGESRFKQVNKELPVIGEFDICVLGGSCTGVFAALRAARLGAKVAIIEMQNAFGGVATNSMVNIWHSLLNTEFNKQIIAGLTVEVIERLDKREAIIRSEKSASAGVTFNSQELKIELDELVIEAGIKPFLHTLFSEPYLSSEGNLAGIIVDNKSGRGIIKAKYFVDATGDGDLCFRLGLDTYTFDLLQPPTMCAYFEGWNGKVFNDLLKQYGKEFNIPEGFVWGARVPPSNVYMLAGTRVYDVNCSIADQLTMAEIEGRRQIRAMMDMIRKYGKDVKIGLVGLPSHIGMRETRHIKCLYQVSDEDALYGKQFDDAIANGSYRLDIHHQDKPGLTFRYLDGTEVYSRPGYPEEKKRWREELPVNPTFYQVPLRSIIPQKFDNLIVAGRMLDASIIAFSGIRVMVNMNQLGEAAGVTSYLALNQNKSIKDVDYKNVREELAKGGSIIL